MLQHSLTVFSTLLIANQCVLARFIIMDNSRRPTFQEYEQIRAEFTDEHLSRALGADVVLNEEEQQLNAIIMGLKADELTRGFENPFNFTPSRHFFEVYASIESSPLYKLIEKMPKGCFLLKSTNPRVKINV